MILIIKHIGIEGPGMVREFLRNTSWDVKEINLNREALPEDISNLEAVITLGGPMNVYETAKYPFLEKEDYFLKKAIALDMPILGICLGSQLIAKAKGAKVSKAAIREIGWFKIGLTIEGKKDPLFSGFGDELEVFQWHEDKFDLPKDAILLAGTTIQPQAFKLKGKDVYGLQFHFEVDAEMIESWIKSYGYTETDSSEIITEAVKNKNEFLQQSNRIMLNFCRLIEKKTLVC